ncbi:hypothetical protein GC197_10885 [bacterium]|nr:hypothetical protein [bacterium]
MRIASRIVFALVAIVLLHPAIVFSAEPDPVENLRAALVQFRDVELQASVQIDHPAVAGSSHGSPLTAEQEIEIKRSGTRSMVSIKESTMRPGHPIWRTQTDFIVQANGDLYQWNAMLDKALQQIHAKGESGLFVTSAQLGGNAPDLNRPLDALNDAGAAIWHVGYSPLLDFLDEKADVKATIDHGSAKIVSHTEWGDLTIVTSAKSGWLPESFELVKLLKHYTIRGTIKSEGDSKLKSTVWTCKASNFSKDAAGRWSAAKLDLVRTMNWSDGPAERNHVAIDIKSIKFAPKLTDTDFKTSIVLPVGQKVVVAGETNRQFFYIWNGTEVVPVDPQLFDQPK